MKEISLSRLKIILERGELHDSTLEEIESLNVRLFFASNDKIITKNGIPVMFRFVRIGKRNNVENMYTNKFASIKKFIKIYSDLKVESNWTIYKLI